ncbi:MAG: DNA mismatch repair endonuclease MutL [Zavarzinella sp.]
MGKIYQLPPSVITKIAAGEVIERPASVVKEMVENSIDAGATHIEVDLGQGGIDYIRVVDNGHGIQETDLPMVFASHATSKLVESEDLFRISTLGFRGEAMASIGGVAHVKVQSRPMNAEVGAELDCHGGELSEIRPWNGSVGTRIEVRHLFFNTPVRKKFLRTIPTELGHVSDMLTRLALGYPEIGFTLRHNERLVFEAQSTSDFVGRVGIFYGDEVRDHLFPVESAHNNIHFRGFIGDPKINRGNAKLQYLYLNRRWIRDRSLGHALQESYRGLLMTGRYAVGFLFLEIPPDQVDVNVHPTKTEVRFRDSSAIYALVRSAIKKKLLQLNLVPELRIPADQILAEKPAKPNPGLFELPDYSSPPIYPRKETIEAGDIRVIAPVPEGRPEKPPSFRPAAKVHPLDALEQQESRDSLPHANIERIPQHVPLEKQDSLPERPDSQAEQDQIVQSPPDQVLAHTEFLPDSTTPQEGPAFKDQLFSSYHAIQIHNAFLVVETKDGMLVIDQHALHERILFEQLRRRVLAGALEVQRLLIPEPVELTLDQAGQVLEMKTSLAELGMEIEDFGGGTIALSSYPTLLSRRAPGKLFQDVVEGILEQERTPSRAQLLHHLLATMACKAAVKAGDPLTQEEIDHLMKLRDLAEDSHHCPHGRPTSLVFSKKELEKQFGRI